MRRRLKHARRKHHDEIDAERGPVELAQMVLDSSTSSRRGRGISAAQMRTTRRTIRSVTGLYRQIQSACGGAGMARRASRRAPPFALAKAKCR